MAYRVAYLSLDRPDLAGELLHRFREAMADDVEVDLDLNPPDVLAVDDCLLPVYNAIVVDQGWDQPPDVLEKLHEAARQDRLVKALHGKRLLDLFIEVAPGEKGQPPVMAMRPRPPVIRVA